MKTCSKCKQEKSLADFNKDKNRPDGLYVYCKRCHSLDACAYQRTNRKRRSKYCKEWCHKNSKKLKMQVRLNNIRRRALKKSAKGLCSKEQLIARIRLYEGICYIPGCGKPYEAIDHVIPLAKGGTNWPSNLRPICRSCNSSKGNKSLTEFLKYREPMKKHDDLVHFAQVIEDSIKIACMGSKGFTKHAFKAPITHDGIYLAENNQLFSHDSGVLTCPVCVEYQNHSTISYDRTA